MRIHIHAAKAPYVHEHHQLVVATLAATRTATLVDDPDDADIILLLPGFGSKFRRYAAELLDDPVIGSQLDKVLVFECCDGPTDYLRGVYVNLTEDQFDPQRHRSIEYLLPSHGFRGETQPSLLFSFRGALSHPTRSAICNRLVDAPEGRVTPMDRWLNYTPTETEIYLRELCDSSFVLCPRGLGPSTIRLQETMEAGRVPVIISDAWLPPKGVDWEGISIRCPEGDIDRLPTLLESRRDEAPDMGRRARSEWERMLQPGEPFGCRLVDFLREVLDATPPSWTPRLERRRWASARFRWRAGYDPFHRGMNRVRRFSRR